MTAAPPFAAIVKDRRLALDMTQAAVAATVGVGVPYVSKMEAGRETPSEDVIVKIAEVLGLDPFELVLAAGRTPGDVMDRLAAATADRDALASIVRDLAEATTDVGVAGVQHVAREWVARQEAE